MSSLMSLSRVARASLSRAGEVYESKSFLEIKVAFFLSFHSLNRPKQPQVLYKDVYQ